MDTEFVKALGGLGFSTLIGGVIAVLVKRQTEKEGSRLAEDRFALEERSKHEEELAERRKEEAARRDELRQDLKSERERNELLVVRLSKQSELYEDRIAACRACGYYCVDKLKEHAVNKVPDTS